MIKTAERSSQEHANINLSKGRQQGGVNSKTRLRHLNLFHALLASDLPADEKTSNRLAHEGFEILLAGSDTTARTMGIAMYHILANPDIGVRLKEELEHVLPNPQDVIDVKVLENLPWLVREIVSLDSMSQKS